MTRSTRRILTLCTIALIFSVFACSSTSEAGKSKKPTKEMKEPTTESVEQNEKNFYLMLRLEKDQSTDEIKIKTVEREVYQKAGNPLPTQGVFDGKQLFTCELTGKNGKIIRKVEQKINLDLGPAKNEGILKFIIPFPKDAHHVEVKHLTLDGVWITIYSDKL